MTEDHEYQKGAFGRCAVCNRRKASHEAPEPETTVTTNVVDSVNTDIPVVTPTLPPGITFDYAPPPPLSLDETPPKGMEVIVRRKHGMGMGSSDEEVTWPADWPLPKIGESVWLNNVSGVVTDIRFDLDRNRIIVACK